MPELLRIAAQIDLFDGHLGVILLRLDANAAIVTNLCGVQVAAFAFAAACAYSIL
jgi:hypothetical protein